MNEVDGVANRYRTAITKMNQDNGAEVIRALYLAQPVLREYVEEAQGVAVIDDANPPLYLRLNRLLKEYKDLADPVAEIKKQDPVAAEKILALDKALDALPRVKGIVFRGGAVSKHDAALMRSGKLSLYSVAPFWSTSSNFKDATGFAVRSGGADREQTVFIIQTRAQRAPLTHNPAPNLKLNHIGNLKGFRCVAGTLIGQRALVLRSIAPRLTIVATWTVKLIGIRCCIISYHAGSNDDTNSKANRNVRQLVLRTTIKAQGA